MGGVNNKPSLQIVIAQCSRLLGFSVFNMRHTPHLEIKEGALQIVAAPALKEGPAKQLAARRLEYQVLGGGPQLNLG